jgi:uncharacterized protein (TIGR02145 family)
MHYSMSRLCTLVVLAFTGLFVSAQGTLNIHEVGGQIIPFPLANIDSVTHELMPAPGMVFLHHPGGFFSDYSFASVDSITVSAGGDPGTAWIATRTPSNVTSMSATAGGVISYEADAPVTERGICWALSQNPTVADNVTPSGSGAGDFQTEITGLMPGMTYYARAYAINAMGTAYGNMISFTTLGGFGCGLDFVDTRDGKVYTSVQIGGQCWMGNNLGYLPAVSPASDGSDNAPYYYVYGHDGTEVAVAEAQPAYGLYGALYNWAAVLDGSPASGTVPSGVQGVCPAGWHVPSDDEWKLLEIAIGMDPVQADLEGFRGTNEGSKLGSFFNQWPDGELRNDPEFGVSGFAAGPAGTRMAEGSFIQLNEASYWWTAGDEQGQPYMRMRSGTSSQIFRAGLSGSSGASVRCVRDQ